MGNLDQMNNFEFLIKSATKEIIENYKSNKLIDPKHLDTKKTYSKNKKKSEIIHTSNDNQLVEKIYKTQIDDYTKKFLMLDSKILENLNKILFFLNQKLTSSDYNDIDEACILKEIVNSEEFGNI